MHYHQLLPSRWRRHLWLVTVQFRPPHHKGNPKTWPVYVAKTFWTHRRAEEFAHLHDGAPWARVEVAALPPGPLHGRRTKSHGPL